MPDQLQPLVRSENPVEDLLEVMRRLRDPQNGCPWDIEQTFETIAPYTIEEAYEVGDAIARKDMDDLKEELGDLFLQVVFHSQMAEEAGLFSINDVASAIVDKMIRRHPHVFSDADIRSADAQTVAWEEQKAEERASKAGGDTQPSALDGVALPLPALTRAEKLQKRAARTGFDWPNTTPILAKLEEELAELEEAVRSEDLPHMQEEMGDVLFVVANLARKHGLDPELCLRAANDKFTQRFKGMEALSEASDQAFASLSLEQQEALWQRVKHQSSTSEESSAPNTVSGSSASSS